MSFYEIYAQYRDFDFNNFFNNVTESDVLRSINKDNLDPYEFLTLLSPTTENLLEEMAQKSHALTMQHFGKTIKLYTPMYLANYCVNKCSYCGFNVENKISRKKLNLEEIERESIAISKEGLRHILILTGESRKVSPISYIIDAVKVLKKYFDSISIEIYPLTTEEYKSVVDAGVDGLTLYQETYDEKIYDRIHLAGPKKDYKNRLDAPERGCKANMRTVGIGALLGLNHWRKEAFYTGLHAKYLQDKYSSVDISVSLPRIRPHVGCFEDVYPVDDKALVQVLTAFRLFLPRMGVTLSTREPSDFRDNLIPLGITQMSAGVSTEVGGHSSEDKSESQFEISDKRSVGEMKNIILAKGYQPVFKDWMQI